jgi:hypothetical protein
MTTPAPSSLTIQTNPSGLQFSLDGGSLQTAPQTLTLATGSTHTIAVGGLCHIDASFGQSCDDTDRPCMSGGPTTTENQSNVFNHLPTIAARGHSRPLRYQDRASRPVSRLFTVEDVVAA